MTSYSPSSSSHPFFFGGFPSLGFPLIPIIEFYVAIYIQEISLHLQTVVISFLQIFLFLSSLHLQLFWRCHFEVFLFVISFWVFSINPTQWHVVQLPSIIYWLITNNKCNFYHLIMKKIELTSDRSTIHLHYDVLSEQNELGEVSENVGCHNTYLLHGAESFLRS